MRRNVIVRLVALTMLAVPIVATVTPAQAAPHVAPRYLPPMCC
jgi:hypothetical protein